MQQPQSSFLSALVIFLACACSSPDKPDVIRLDYATYNPLSLLLRDRRYLEDALEPQGVRVEWLKSLGSNKALELLNSRSIDFGSTAVAAALIARANKNPIRAIYVYSKPEWTALVTRADTGIRSVSDLKGKKVAATRGTDPFVFLLRALDSVGLSEQDIELVPLQHPDGKLALERGDVQAWAGLDPLMASAEIEAQATLFYRNANWNSYGVLDVRQEFAQRYPGYVDRVLEAYEKARARALANPAELSAALAQEAKLTEPVTRRVLERTDLSSSALGDAQLTAILAAGDVLRKSGVIASESDVRGIANELLDRSFSERLGR